MSKTPNPELSFDEFDEVNYPRPSETEFDEVVARRLSRREFLAGMLMLHSFPSVTLLISIFILLRSLGLYDTLIGVILVKASLELPFGVWMSEDKQLRELAYDSLAGFRRRGYLNPGYLDRLTDAHRDGHSAYYGVMIWVIMMLELWLQEHA